MATKFFRYSGAKSRFVGLINLHLKTKKRVYCEPFVGSGAVVFNLTQEFDQYILGDIDRNIIAIYKAFSKLSYSDYIEILKSLSKEFSDFETTKRCGESFDKAKENYYSFRDWFNSEHWNTGSIEEGVYLHVLANSCLNSFLRFGPNGMNQSFGARSNLIIPQGDFVKIKSILSKTRLYCGSYKKLLTEEAFFFLDPPYAYQDSSYLGFTKDDLRDFIHNIRNKEFLYTDILCDENSILENRVKIRDMVSTAPSTAKKWTNSGHEEFLFSSKPLIKGTKQFSLF